MRNTSTKSRKGINPKKWFYALRERLRKRDVKTVLAGAKCEQWINSELFKIVAYDLGKDQTVYPELDKRDLAVLRCSEKTPDNNFWNATPLAVVETKMLYYTSHDHDVSLEKLRFQLLKDSDRDTLRMGLVFGVFRDWRCDQTKKSKINFDDFRSSVGKKFAKFCSDGFDEFNLAVDHSGHMETIVNLTNNKIGSRNVPVAMIGQYVVLRK